MAAVHSLTRAGLIPYLDLLPHVAQDAEGEQEAQEEPPPATIPSSPSAANREIIRCVSWLSHSGHAIGSSACDMPRRASKRVPHSEHWYSYSGIRSFPSSLLRTTHHGSLPSVERQMMSDDVQPLSHLFESG